MKNRMKFSTSIAAAALFVSVAPAPAQAQVTKEMLLHPPADSWPTFFGDYSARRFSPLKEINSTNVQNLSLEWATRFTPGPAGTAVNIKSPALLVNGILYFTSPNNGWAADARTGRELWHYGYPPNTGNTNGNRGFGYYGNWLYMETPDGNLVCLNAADGKERWKVRITDAKLDYTTTAAPIVVGNHIIVGVGGDHLDNPGFIQSVDPETGALQWKTNTTPRKGEPGIETWPDEYAAAHATGQTWIPGSYDPELNLYIFGTGNPNPVMAEQSRKGDNLYTCTILAINPDTGKIVWYYQATPHDTHDWDSTESVIMIDGVIDGKPRKLVAQANRNGYFYVLDRTNGEHILTQPMIEGMNWNLGLNEKGQPIPNPAKYPKPDGTLVLPASGGATSWVSASFSPQTNLFYVGVNRTWSVYYQTDTDDHPEGYGGVDSSSGAEGGSLLAIDYRTGKAAWKHDWPGGGGPSHMLTTAGHLLFTGNGNNIIAFDPANGKILWHAGLMAGPSNGMTTYMLDGRQHLLVGAGDSLYSFVMNKPAQ
jgi:alcohol dehydrogenase (cytochrome c)